jgi:hypothetical protein
MKSLSVVAGYPANIRRDLDESDAQPPPRAGRRSLDRDDIGGAPFQADGDADNLSIVKLLEPIYETAIQQTARFEKIAADVAALDRRLVDATASNDSRFAEVLRRQLKLESSLHRMEPVDSGLGQSAPGNGASETAAMDALERGAVASENAAAAAATAAAAAVEASKNSSRYMIQTSLLPALLSSPELSALIDARVNEAMPRMQAILQAHVDAVPTSTNERIVAAVAMAMDYEKRLNEKSIATAVATAIECERRQREESIAISVAMAMESHKRRPAPPPPPPRNATTTNLSTTSSTSTPSSTSTLRGSQPAKPVTPKPSTPNGSGRSLISIATPSGSVTPPNTGKPSRMPASVPPQNKPPPPRQTAAPQTFAPSEGLNHPHALEKEV